MKTFVSSFSVDKQNITRQRLSDDDDDKVPQRWIIMIENINLDDIIKCKL
jgi:hypothetical protein